MFQIGRINTVKMLLPKAVYKFSAVPIKSPVAFLTVEKNS